MPVDYIPTTDAGALQWLLVFSEHLSDTPAVYQVSAGEAAGVASAVAAYQAALGDATDPATRTPATVDLKNEMRNAAIQLARQYAQLIRVNAGISNQAKIDAGVRPINPTRDPVNCPESSPGILVVAATQGAHTLRFADTLNPSSNGKPFGAENIQLFVAIDDEPIEDPGEAKFYGAFTKNPLSVSFVSTDNGKRATYFARWAGRNGQVGNWSNPVTMAIAA